MKFRWNRPGNKCTTSPTSGRAKGRWLGCVPCANAREPPSTSITQPRTGFEKTTYRLWWQRWSPFRRLRPFAISPPHMAFPSPSNRRSAVKQPSFWMRSDGNGPIRATVPISTQWTPQSCCNGGLEERSSCSPRRSTKKPDQPWPDSSARPFDTRGVSPSLSIERMSKGRFARLASTCSTDSCPAFERTLAPPLNQTSGSTDRWLPRPIRRFTRSAARSGARG